MLRKLPLLLIAVLALCALPQTALAKRHVRHAACHGHRHCVTHATSRTASVTDPATTISDPGTTISDPGTTISDPGTTISDPGNPSEACRAEQDDDHFADGHDGEDFDHFYGTNPNLRNAFGQCVSHHAHEHCDHGDDTADAPQQSDDAEDPGTDD